MKPDICTDCTAECEIPCSAYRELQSIYKQLRTAERTEIIKRLRAELGIKDAEVADDLQVLGERLIAAMPELGIIPAFEIKVGYVRSYEKKADKGKAVEADCRKVNKTYGAYLPYDFIITFYEPNMYYLTENQKKILMLHELKHIGVGEHGLRIEYHDVEDFADILNRFGIGWNWLDKEVPDILTIE